MKFRWIAAGLTLLAGVLITLGVTGAPARGEVIPAWEIDAYQPLGAITLFDATGAVVTQGDLDQHPLAFYAVAHGPGRAGDDRALLRLCTPQVGAHPLSWTCDQMSATTPYPNPAAPPNVAGLWLPVVSGASTDLSFGEYIGIVPNLLTSPGYQNLYELRLHTSGQGQGPDNRYYRIDVLVNVLGTNGDQVTGTWQVVYPAPGPIPTPGPSPTGSPTSTPSPTTSPSPTPSATESPSPSASPSPTPSPSPSPTPGETTTTATSSGGGTGGGGGAGSGGVAGGGSAGDTPPPTGSSIPSASASDEPDPVPLPVSRNVGGPLSVSGGRSDWLTLLGLALMAAVAAMSGARLVILRRRRRDFAFLYDERND